MLARLLVPCLLSGLVAQAPKPGSKPAASPPAHQEPVPKPVPAESPPARVNPVQFDSSGWPIVDEPAATNVPPPAPAVETKKGDAKVGTKAPPASTSVVKDAEQPAEPLPKLVSGTQLGSPLLDVYQFVHAPAAFRELGGVQAWWRLSTYGAQGEVIGVREITHTADCAFAERDRLELADGRVYGRSGASVFAERNGMPWPTLTETAQQDLLLFGLHLRMPWCFGDATTFVVVGKDNVVRSGETLARVTVERRPAIESETLGPEVDPAPRDRFELLYEPSNGAPREFVHRLACSKETRRVLLEDWREISGVKMPFRRVYVDEALRQTTTIELLRIESSRTSDRDFRLR
ncbi:MAG: hypothetical protein JNK78_07895 [Planctomycetes bacterium]|nr:hypothetical protein [Planctomycetota bacterium]